MSDDGETALTPKEVALLTYLWQRAGETVPRTALLVDVWGYRPTVVTRTIDTTVQRVRAKIELDSREPRHLLTEPGVGYRFVGTGDEAAAVQSNLGPEPNAFVGRESDVAELRAVLELHRLVTVLGPPGIGKTRLCQHIVRTWSGEGQAWFVDLRGTTEVVATVKATLGIDGDVGAALAERAGLVVLDNFEHVLDAADTIDTWSRAAPETRLLVTSRVPLGLAVEHQFRLEPLSEADANALFVSRANSVRRGFDSADSAIPRITERLDGLPLAIELAAARTRVLSPGQIEQRLSLDLLRGKDRTLRGAIDWSWGQLTDEARRGLASASTFRGSFGFDDAEAVLDVHDVLEVLQELVDHSLVQALSGDEIRFELLQSVREFATSHRDDDAVHRHRRWAATTGAALIDGAFGFGAERHTRLLAMVDDLVAAFEDALPDHPDDAGVLVLVLAQHANLSFRQRHAWLDAAVAVQPTAAVVARRGDTRRILGDHEGAAADLDAAEQATDDPTLLARIQGYRGLLARDSGDFDGAVAHHRQAVAGHVDTLERAMALINLGGALSSSQRYDEAVTEYLGALRLVDALGYTAMQATVRVNLGDIAFQQHRLDEAETHLTEGLELSRRARRQQGEAVARANLGILRLEQGDTEKGVEHLAEAVHIGERLGRARLSGLFRAFLGAGLAMAGDPTATEVLTSAKAWARTDADRALVALCMAHLHPETREAALQAAEGHERPELRTARRLLSRR